MSLTIGILECDHVPPKMINYHGDYHEMFTALLQIHDSFLTFKVFDLINNQFPEDLTKCDAYLITGSKHGVYDDIPWINKSKILVKRLFESNIPTVGICFGHQLIAESLGGKVTKEKTKGRGLGVQHWNIKHEQDWMDTNNLESIALNACHQDQVIKMPPGSKLLIESEFCPVAGFQKGPMLGIQGHPEFEIHYTKYLFNKYKDTLDTSKKTKVIKSLTHKPNSNLVGKWIVTFIKSQLAIS